MKKTLVKLSVVLTSVLAVSGCITPDLPELGKDQLVMYGRVNTWAMGKSNLEKDISAIRDEDVDGYMIEMMGWARYDAWTSDWMKQTEEQYKTLLDLCRDNGKWLFVSIVNDNMGSRAVVGDEPLPKKYGDPGIKLSQVMPQAQQLCQIVKKHGKDNVIVQPVAETQTSAGVQFEQYCLQQLGGFIMVYNGGVGRPNTIPGGFQYRAWHPFKITDNPPKDSFVVSDTGSIILQLGYGYDGVAKPDTLEAWARRMRQIGVPVVGYYAFQFNGHDKEAIKALGRSKK